MLCGDEEDEEGRGLIAKGDIVSNNKHTHTHRQTHTHSHKNTQGYKDTGR